MDIDIFALPIISAKKHYLKELQMSIFVKGFLDYSAKAFRGSLGKKLVEHGAKALIFLLCVRDLTLCEHLFEQFY